MEELRAPSESGALATSRRKRMDGLRAHARSSIPLFELEFVHYRFFLGLQTIEEMQLKSGRHSLFSTRVSNIYYVLCILNGCTGNLFEVRGTESKRAR